MGARALGWWGQHHGDGSPLTHSSAHPVPRSTGLVQEEDER